MKYIKYGILIIAAALLSSCIENPSGLFYSLQSESAIYDGTLDNGLTIGGMAERNSYYFIGAGNVKYKSTADTATTWTDDNPDILAGLDYTCYKLFNLDEIYAIYFNSESLDYKFFKADTSLMATNGITWGSEIVITGLDGEKLVDVVSSNNTLFLYTETTVTGVSGSEKRYSVYTTPFAALAAGTVITTEASLSSLASYGELDVDWDGTEYYLVSGNMLFKGTSGSWTDITSTAVAAHTDGKIKGNGFGGLICVGPDIYLSTEEGVLLKYSAGSWSDLTSTAVLNRIYDFKRFTVTDENIDILLLGSELGYYELDLDATTPAFSSPETADTMLTSKVQFASIELSNDIVRDFFVDSDNTTASRVFALGYNAGMWKNSYKTAKTERFWDLE
jgi:hypothetical protein